MVDTIAATELVLSVDNDGALYRSARRPIIANLCKHVAKGDYTTEGARTAFLHLAEIGAKWYAREYAQAHEWAQIFPPATRREAAAQWARAFEIEYDCNQWDGINPVPADKRPASVPGKESVA